jgi:hypothetical protein
MNNNIIKNIIHKVVKQSPPVVLGRWNVDYCSKKINQKIDFSNEDHCGTCSKTFDEPNSYNKVQHDNFLCIFIPN